MKFKLHANIQTAYLEVVIPPDIIYEETSGDMMVPEGSSAKLVCKARGFPKPKITWRREDGREIIARNGPHGKTKGISVIRNDLEQKCEPSICLCSIGRRR